MAGAYRRIVPLIQDVGPDVRLLVDGNSALLAEEGDRGRAHAGRQRHLATSKSLAHTGRYHWTKQVTDALNLDVTGGEQDCDLALWRFAIDMRAVDVVQPMSVTWAASTAR